MTDNIGISDGPGGSPQRSAFVASGHGGLAPRRDGQYIGDRHATPPPDYYRSIRLEYWFAALCAGGLGWAALLTRF